jgi:MazG family protein
LDALDREDMVDLEEELGDLLLQIVLHAQIATEEGDFNIHQVVDGVGAKLIRRHPHVFSEVEVSDVSGVIRNWEAIKAEERGENGNSNKEGLLDGVPRALPALSQAQEVIERVGRVDFNLLLEQGSIEDLREELAALERAGDGDQGTAFGELFLSAAALAYRHGIDAESALRERLMNVRLRFSWMEARAKESGKALLELSEAEKEHLWDEAQDALKGEEGA